MTYKGQQGLYAGSILLALILLSHGVYLTNHDFDTMWRMRRPSHLESDEKTLPLPLPLPLPPSLADTNPLFKRPSNPPPIDMDDWTRPHILTASALDLGDGEAMLTILTSGIDLSTYNRSLSIVGCALGDATYALIPTIRKFEVARCRVPTEALSLDGTKVTVLLAHDDALKKALDKPQAVRGVHVAVDKADIEQVDEDSVQNELILENAQGNPIVSVRSGVAWRRSSLDPAWEKTRKRYNVCMMANMKMYLYLLPQWIEHYRRLGVDRFYLYDNAADEDLTKYANEFVEVLYWPFARSQLQANTHFLQTSKSRCKFAAFVDLDEFVMLGDSNLGALGDYVDLRVNEGCNEVSFPYLEMAMGAYVKTPQGYLSDLIVHRRKEQIKTRTGKAVLDTDHDWDHHLIHSGAGRGRVRCHNTTLDLTPSKLSDNAPLVHFRVRSWEDFVLKHRIGTASYINGNIREVQYDVDKPPRWILANITDDVYYPHFRSYQRSLMSRPETYETTLVWQEGEQQCRVKYCPDCEEGLKFRYKQCK